MDNQLSTCPPLEKFRDPAGDCITLTAYREYVCGMLADQLSFDEYRDLMTYFRCSADEVVDKVVETKMVGIPRRGRKVR